MKRSQPNIVIRERFKDAFRHKRHIKLSALTKWFQKLDHWAPDENDKMVKIPFTPKEKRNGFRFLQHDGRIVIQENMMVWNAYGPKKMKYVATLDVDNIGNIPYQIGGHTGIHNYMIRLAHGV